MGDRIYALAVMWIAWEKFGAGAMGLVAIAESLPYIVVGAIGRRAVDRFASLAGLAWLDVARALLVAVLPWTWAMFGLPGLLVSAALIGVGGALFDPNLAALVPDLVEPDQVQAVNGLMDLTGRIARVAGPGSAGILLAAMPMAGLFWLDAMTFAVSAVALRRLARSRPAPAHASAAGQGVGDGARTEPVPEPVAESGAAAGPQRTPGAWALVRVHRDTGAMLAVHAMGIFAAAVAMAMPALLATRLQAGAGTYGTVLAVTGVGALVGNGVVGNLRLPRRAAEWYCLTWAASGVVLALTGMAASLPLLLVLSAVSGALSPLLAVTLMTHLARYQPAARRRLLTADQTLIRTAGTLSMLVIPAAAAANPTAGFLVGGAATAVTGLAAAATLILWSRTRTATAGSEPAAAVRLPEFSAVGRG